LRDRRIFGLEWLIKIGDPGSDPLSLAMIHWTNAMNIITTTIQGKSVSARSGAIEGSENIREAGGGRLEAGGWRLEAGGGRREAGGGRREAGTNNQ